MELNKQFRQFGHKMTSGRETTIDVASETDNTSVRKTYILKVHSVNPKIGLTTVYRTLELLINMGWFPSLISEMAGRDTNCGRLQGAKHHHHLVCTGADVLSTIRNLSKRKRHFSKESS